MFTHGAGGQFIDSEIKNCTVGVRVESGAEPTFCRCLVRETDTATCDGGNPRLHGCDVIGKLRIKGSGQFTQCNICSMQNQSGKDGECALEKLTLLKESKEKLATAAAREKKDDVVHTAAMQSLQSKLPAGDVHLKERQQTKRVDGRAHVVNLQLRGFHQKRIHEAPLDPVGQLETTHIKINIGL